jgi:hypothetical protein
VYICVTLVQGVEATVSRPVSPPSPPISRFVGGRCGALSADTTPPRSPMTGLTYSRRLSSRRAREVAEEGDALEPISASSQPETTSSEADLTVPSDLPPPEFLLPLALAGIEESEVRLHT